MSGLADAVIGTEAQDDDAEALAAMMAGYNARAAKSAPAQEVTTSEPAVIAQVAEVAAPEASSTEEAEPAAPTLEERLAAFKEEIRLAADTQEPAAVRRLHGEIGDMNRRLKAMETKPAPAPAAPVDDELTAAMGKAEALAAEYPELAGPLVEALKAVTKAKPNAAPQGQALSQDDINRMVEERAAQQVRQLEERQRKEAEKVLKVDHPDFDTVIASKEFSSWVKTKPAELQDTIVNTENPMLAARFLSEFKETQRTTQKKTDRLKGAITPQGVTSQAAPSKLPDEQGLWVGYNKGQTRPMNKR